MRKNQDYNEWRQPLSHQTLNDQNKHNLPFDHLRAFNAPSRVQERMSASPLKFPLEKAIKKAVKATARDSSMQKSNSQSRFLGRSNRKQESSIFYVAKKIFYEQDPETQLNKAHPETMSFIRKYFDHLQQEISRERFVGILMKEYESLWGTQNADKIYEDFTYKIQDIFGGYDTIDLRELIRITKDDGMIGLILRIFKEIKNEENVRNSDYVSFSQKPHIASLQRSFEDKIIENDSINSIKNIIQELMESMYQAMEGQIYAKFNVEMRRMIVKYRQAQKLLRKINQKVTNHADILDAEVKNREKSRRYQEQIEELKKQKLKLNQDLNKERDSLWNQKRDRERLYQENEKLKQNVEKYQKVILNKAMDNSFIESGLSKNFSTHSKFAQNNQKMQLSQTPQQPFKITIDTHFIQKENQPPQSKIFATLHNPRTNNVPSISPNRRQSFENNRYCSNNSNVSPSHFTASRMSNYKPISPVSPYPTRVSKPSI